MRKLLDLIKTSIWPVVFIATGLVFLPEQVGPQSVLKVDQLVATGKITAQGLIQVNSTNGVVVSPTIDSYNGNPSGVVSATVGSIILSTAGNIYESAGGTTWNIIGSSGGLPVLNVHDFGALCDGVTDDRAAIQTALNAAVGSTGKIVYFPPGTCIVGRNGANSYELDMPGSNISLLGVRGNSIIKSAAGLPATSISILRIDNVSNITIRDLTFDGNWGNAVTAITAASNGAALPQGTINVGSTVGFPGGVETIIVVSDAGPQSVTCTGTTSTTFTGCAGGLGNLITGQGVGYHNDINGINQSTQVDPQNHGIMIRGANRVLIDNVQIQDTYGDGIWIGTSSTSVSIFANDVRILNTDINISARNGVSLAQWCENIRVTNVRMSNIWQQSVDTEPVGQPVKHIIIEGSFLGNWFSPGNTNRDLNDELIVRGGGGTLNPSPLTFASDYRVTNNEIVGGVLIIGASNINISGNYVHEDWPTIAGSHANPPIFVLGYNEDVWINNNEVYTYIQATSGVNAGIDVAYTANGSESLAPKKIKIFGNKVHVRNSNIGIDVNGSGGNDFGGLLTPGVTGTASAVSSSTLTDGTATWTVNQWKGYFVTMGGVSASIVSNTATVLTLLQWITPTGGNALTPATGTYIILSDGGFVDIEGNEVDSTNDGNGAGGRTIDIMCDRAGMRLKIVNNTLKDCATDGIRVNATNRIVQQVELRNNTAWDNQVVHTCTNTITITTIANIVKLIMNGNVAGDGVTNVLAGVVSGTWLIRDGSVPAWAGFGSPESVVTAPVSATYQRLNGTGVTVEYVKGSGTGNTGWLAGGGGFNAGATTFTVNGSVLDTTAVSSVDHGSLGTGSTNWTGSVTGIGANNAVVLTFGGGGYANRVRCMATVNASGTPEFIAVTNSKTAPTFSCFNSTTGAAANCVDFSYQCVGQ